MPTYKELMMSRDTFRELRTEIRHALETNREMPRGEILTTDIDRDTGDLLVTSRYGLGGKAVQCTHRITIKDENATPALPSVIEPPDGMPYMVVAMLQATIEEAWQQYGGDPTNSEQFWNFLVGNGVADVPRETLPNGEEAAK